MGKVKRDYDSPKRRQQAEETRRRLVGSARRLFGRTGYAATTIEAIATEAGVAVQTFYATYGSKRAILLALLDEVEVEADLSGLLKRLEESRSDPHRQLRLVVDFNAALYQRAGDVLEVLRAAGDADAALVSVWREGERRRREGQAPLVGAWARSRALAPGLSAEEAADVLWVLTGPDNHRLFTAELGWPVARYADWLYSALERFLFGG